MSSTSGPERFYDLLAGDYDDAIVRCVPRYFEMLDMILRYVPQTLNPQRVLELGSGSGHLTRRVLKAYPRARVYAVDLSEEMLRQCRRTTESSRLNLIHMDFHDLCVARASFDLVVSSISIHHIDDPSKGELFRGVHECLRPGGVLSYSDQFAGGTAETYRRHIESWKKDALELGASPEEWSTWMRHQDDHDHHASLRDQLEWLRGAGFTAIDCVWRYLLWTVVVAECSPDSA